MWELILVLTFTSTSPGGAGGWQRQQPSASTQVVSVSSEFNTNRECLASLQDVQQQASHFGGQAIVAACRPKGQSN